MEQTREEEALRLEEIYLDTKARLKVGEAHLASTKARLIELTEEGYEPNLMKIEIRRNRPAVTLAQWKAETGYTDQQIDEMRGEPKDVYYFTENK